MLTGSSRNLVSAIMLMVLIILTGTLGYMSLESWTAFDSFYMTVITISTVGYSEVAEMSDAGRILTVFLIFSGAGSMAYAFGTFVQYLVEGHLKKKLGWKKLERKIKKLSDHYIVCGYGRIGAIICRELAARPVPFVIVDSDEERVEIAIEEGYLAVHGDATCDDVLEKAGIQKAQALVAAVATDTENVFITLTAKGLNPRTYIMSRATDEESVKKLGRVGANKVIAPYTYGAKKMAHALLRPGVLDFVETATGGRSLNIQMEEVRVSSESRLTNETLKSSGVRALGVNVVAIRKTDGKLMVTPPSHAIIEAGDSLIVCGTKESICKLEEDALVYSHCKLH